MSDETARLAMRSVYGPLLGRWVLVQGVRTRYRGRLTAVYWVGGDARLLFDVLYDLDQHSQANPSEGDGEQPLRASLAAPAVLLEGAILSVSLQPVAWPEE